MYRKGTYRLNIEEVKRKLSEAIQNSGFTHKQLAEKIGVSESAISNYSRGKRLPRVLTFARLCRCLKISSSFVLGLQSDKNDSAAGGFLVQNPSAEIAKKH